MRKIGVQIFIVCALILCFGSPQCNDQLSPTLKNEPLAGFTHDQRIRINGVGAATTVAEHPSLAVWARTSGDAVEKHWEFFSTEAWLVYLTGLLALITGFLALYTGKLYRATVQLGKEAQSNGEDQGKKMEASIREATRAASAMEALAEATKSNALLLPDMLSKQMRAYLQVEIGQAVHQAVGIKFAASPIIVNKGVTPAKNVCFTLNAAILSSNMLPNFMFEDRGEKTINDAGLAAGQHFIISCIVAERYSEAEVADIVDQNDKSLFVWGTVTYDDVFGGAWKTDYCHNYNFFRDGEKIGFNNYYFQRHNGST
ncbi:putative lipoprotein [Collimonas arenae]|uniref:Putative lipoprotein n=1 Tax=Collimonas arenae TaxID=279058 RepID=A0A127QHD9_9BURK|nr:hypothetical protein [Collimonas arenae]AMP09477.1 putative lipoprotein [Collimonas arenae]